MSFFFEDKRDEKGCLLKYEAMELGVKLAKHGKEILSKYEIYGTLIKYIPEEYVEALIEKHLYTNIKNIANQITIKKYDSKFKENINEKLNLDSFIEINLLKKIISTFFKEDLNFKLGSLFISNKKIFYLNLFIFKFLEKINFLKKIFWKRKKNNKISKIGIFYSEGLSLLTKRSDISCFIDSKIDPSRIKIFYKSKEEFRYENYSDVRKNIKNLNFQLINLSKIYYLNSVDIFKVIEKKTKKKTNDLIEKWFLNFIYTNIQKIKYWHSIFEKHDIKILKNYNEMGIETILQQIAINKIGGCSINKMKSLVTNNKGNSFHSFPNDVFFVWGKLNINNYINSNSLIKNYIINGFPYHFSTLREKFKSYYEDIFSIKKQFINKGSNFTILLLDSNHDTNKMYTDQVVLTSHIVKVYNLLLNQVLNNKNLSIIIKTKKLHFLKELREIKNNLDNCLKTGRCYIEKETGTMSSSYKDIIDYVVSVCDFPPAAFFEIIAMSKRGIIYDYSDSKAFKNEIDPSYLKKLIFTNLEDFLNNIKIGIEDPNSGNWDTFLDQIDPFRDHKGGDRMSFYLEKLLESLDLHNNNKESINLANTFYTKKYGKNKLFRQL